MRFFRRVTLAAMAVACAALLCSGLTESKPASAQCPPIVVMAEMVHGRMTYSLNSKPTPDPLRALGIADERYGDSCPVVGLIDSRAPIDETATINGLADKAGFTKVRYYVFNKESRIMSTLEFGPNLPLSMTPPAK